MRGVENMPSDILYNILFIVAVVAVALVRWYTFYGVKRRRKKKELDDKLMLQGRFTTGNAHQFNSLDRRR